jgi:hypothetical protein
VSRHSRLETRLDFSVLAVAAAVSIGTALPFGIGPALALVLTNVQEVLKEGGRTASASRRVMTTGQAMVAVQVAFTIVLLSLPCAWTLASAVSGPEEAP